MTLPKERGALEVALAVQNEKVLNLRTELRLAERYATEIREAIRDLEREEEERNRRTLPVHRGFKMVQNGHNRRKGKD